MAKCCNKAHYNSWPDLTSVLVGNKPYGLAEQSCLVVGNKGLDNKSLAFVRKGRDNSSQKLGHNKGHGMDHKEDSKESVGSILEDRSVETQPNTSCGSMGEDSMVVE